MRLVRLAPLVAAVVGALLPYTAQAATPASGTLARAQRVLSWKGGPFVASQPNYLAAGCAAGANDPMCDHYALKIALGDGAEVEVSVTTPSPNPPDGIQPLDGDDYDLFVYAPNGVLVAEAANTKGNETVVFTHRARYGTRPYEVRVSPWFVQPGSTYTGTARALTVGN